MIEVKDDKLVIDGVPIGDEEYLLSLFRKAVKYDKLKEAIFKKDGDA